MIALDTNVLVRYIVADDPSQAGIAARLIEQTLTSAEPGFVGLIVLVELIWVLERIYAVPMPRIVEIVSELAASPVILVEQADVVLSAVASPLPHLVDALIHEVGRAQGCRQTATFDQRFARKAGVTLLP